MQLADALGAGVHTVPHVPQLSGLAATLASQPVPTSPSQSAKPAEHARLQARAVQIPVPLTPPAQRREHTPQLVLSAPTFVSHPLDTLPSQSA